MRQGFAIHARDSYLPSIAVAELRMSNWTPTIVPGGDGETVYLVADDFGHHGRCWRETDIKQTDLENVIVDLLKGEYSDPVRVISFNTAEGWSRDISEQVASELRYTAAGSGSMYRPTLSGLSSGM